MANKTIEQLTAAGTLTGNELFHTSQGGNSRKITLAALQAINWLTGKTTPVDADEFRIADSAASYGQKKLTFANFKAAIWSFLQGTYITPWTAYTPTFTGLGTVSSVSMLSRRVGDTLEIMGKFAVGTPTATEARITIGSGLTVDTTKVPSLRHCGNIIRGTNTSIQYYPMATGGDAYLTIGNVGDAADAFSKRLGTELFVTGNVVSFSASIPITGW